MRDSFGDTIPEDEESYEDEIMEKIIERMDLGDYYLCEFDVDLFIPRSGADLSFNVDMFDYASLIMNELRETVNDWEQEDLLYVCEQIEQYNGSSKELDNLFNAVVEMGE